MTTALFAPVYIIFITRGSELKKVFEEAGQFIADERGATAIEYGLIAALISVVIIASITSIGKSLKTVFDNINTNLQPSK